MPIINAAATDDLTSHKLRVPNHGTLAPFSCDVLNAIGAFLDGNGIKNARAVSRTFKNALPQFLVPIYNQKTFVSGPPGGFFVSDIETIIPLASGYLVSGIVSDGDSNNLGCVALVSTVPGELPKVLHRDIKDRVPLVIAHGGFVSSFLMTRQPDFCVLTARTASRFNLTDPANSVPLNVQPLLADVMTNGHDTFFANYVLGASPKITCDRAEVSIGLDGNYVALLCPHMNNGVVAVCGSESSYSLSLVTKISPDTLKVRQAQLSNYMDEFDPLGNTSVSATVHSSGRFIVVAFPRANGLKVFQVTPDQLTEVIFPKNSPFFSGNVWLQARQVKFDGRDLLWLAGKGNVSCNIFYVDPTKLPSVVNLGRSKMPGYASAMTALPDGVVVATNKYYPSYQPCRLMEFKLPELIKQRLQPASSAAAAS